MPPKKKQSTTYAPPVRPESLRTISADIYDKKDPRSLVNMLPKKWSDTFEKIVTNDPLVFTISEEEAFKKYSPNTALCRIRFAFWREYERARSKFQTIDVTQISGIVKLPSFYIENLLCDENNLSFILTPPTHYENILDEALSYAMKRIREEVLTLPFKKKEITVISNADGSQEAIENEVVDHQVVDKFLKAAQMLDIRVHGGIVQKNIHLHKQVTELEPTAVQRDLIDIDKRIKELEAMDEVTLTVLPHDTSK